MSVALFVLFVQPVRNILLSKHLVAQHSIKLMKTVFMIAEFHLEEVLLFVFTFIITGELNQVVAHVVKFTCVFAEQPDQSSFSVARLRVPVGCTTELNQSGYQFLQRLFDKYDEVSSIRSCFWSQCPTAALSFLCGIFNNGGFSCSEDVTCFPLLGQRLGAVADRAKEPVLRLSLHAMGCRGLHDCPNHGRGLHLQARLPLSVDVSFSMVCS